jgi:hypothetical protein
MKKNLLAIDMAVQSVMLLAALALAFVSPIFPMLIALFLGIWQLGSALAKYFYLKSNLHGAYFALAAAYVFIFVTIYFFSLELYFLSFEWLLWVPPVPVALWYFWLSIQDFRTSIATARH